MRELVFLHVRTLEEEGFFNILADLVFKIKEVPHPQFKRRDNDLVYTAKVKLANALCPESIVIVRLRLISLLIE